MQNRGLYIISVAAGKLDMHPQTLRKYERAGFVEPPISGAISLYSESDIARLRLIKHFVENMGLNIPGVRLALRLTERLVDLIDHIPARGPTNQRVLKEIEGIFGDLGLRVQPNQSSSSSPNNETNSNESFQVFRDEVIRFISHR